MRLNPSSRRRGSSGSRHPLSRFSAQLALSTSISILLARAIAPSAHAASYYWDTDGSTIGNNLDGTGLGGTGTWDTSTSNWWDTTSLTLWPNVNLNDEAVFTAPSTPLTLRTVTLSSGINANRLSFLRSGYTLTGGDLTLVGTTPTLRANLGETVTINSQILGANGLTVTGGGYIRLGNTSNSYSGTTTISNGALAITNQSTLGSDSSAIVVTAFNPYVGAGGLAVNNLRGFGGGSLVLDGFGGNITMTRALSLQGQGAIGDKGAALVSTGNNTLSGTVDMGVAFSGTNLNTRMIAADGTVNLTGTLNVLGTAASTINSLGGINQAGASFYNVTGSLAGTGTLEGSGGGTLYLNPSDSSGFSGTIRVSGSAASGQSVVRIDSAGVLGTRTSSGTSSVLDLNGGILAVLMDAPDVKVSNGTNANVYLRGSSTIFADHTPNSSVKDQTVAFGSLSFEENLTLTFNSRNGYGMSFTTAPVQGGNADSVLTNNLQGGALLSFTGNFWSNGENTGNRTMTIGGNGNTLINGSIIAAASSFNHKFIKNGTGTLTVTGTASTLDGDITIGNGTLAISDWRAVTNNTSKIHIGATSVAGVLSVVGNNVSQANLTTSKVMNLSGTTGSATILANQTGSSPGLIFNADFTATGAGSKTLFLGGTNIGANTINGAIVQNGTTNVTKVDAGRWVLAGSNSYTGTTTITNGSLQLKANAAASTIINDASAITFAQVNNYAGGTLEFIGQASTSNVESLGVLNYASGGAATIKLTPGSGGTASLIFADINTGPGGTVNFVGGDFTNNKFTLTKVNGSVGSDSIVTRSVYWNGADYAYRQGGVLRAPVYGVDSGTATSASALTASVYNEVTGSFATNTITVPAIKFNGSQTLTINSGQTLTLNGAGVLATGGNSIITGGTALALGAAPLVARVNGGADTLRIESIITGTGGITKSGAGTLVLAGPNTVTGTFTIAEGTVRLSGAGSTIGGTLALTMRQDGILELNGVTPNNVTAFANNGIVRNTSATTDVTFTVGASNGGGTSYGIIEDGGLAKVSVVKLGSTGQNWLGLSTYTGTTTIDSTGIVTINNLQNGGSASGIGASSSAAGNLIFTGTSATQAYGGLNYTGTTNDETDRLFTFNGGVDGGVRIQSNGVNHATSSWTNTGALAFGTNATGNPQGLVLGGASTGDNRFFPIINDNGASKTSLYKSDAGTWFLMATNGYTGATTLNSGTLYANDGSSLPTASNVVFNGGNLATSGAFSRTIGTGSGQMQWTAAGSGGFSASGTPLTVTWGSGNVWGSTPGFLGTGALFLNNSALAKSDVTITSGFDLNGANRTVTVGDNGNIGADFATLSGAITGTGASGLIKNGAGILNLRGANTYAGNTAVTQGTLVVTSLGNSTSPASTATSVGVSGIGTVFDNANSINLGNGTTTAGILEYVGTGETSDRKIRLNTTTGNNQIHADGTGPLILTNVANDMTAGAKILYLRGVSAAPNLLTSQLSDNGGALGVTIDGSTAWILTNSSNNYTGTTSVGTSSATGGALGIGDDNAIGTGTLSIGNGSVFAYGGDRVIANPVSEVNSTNAVTGFIGDYSLTFNGAWSNPTTSASGRYTRNNIVSGKTLTINGNYTFNGIITGTNWNFDGSGDTIINGIINNTNATMGITYVGTGSLTLGGANTYNGQTTVTSGTMRLGANEVIPSGATKGNVVINPGAGLTATLDLNGKTETVNGLTATTDGTAVIDNTSASAASLTFGANDSAVNFGGGLGTYTITDSGAGALSVTKTGTAAMTIPTGVTLTYQGATTVNGGSMTVASPLNGTTSLNVLGATTLALTGGLTAPGAVTSVVAENGATLNLLDGAGNKLGGLTTLQLGSTAGTLTTLKFNVGDDTVAGDELNTDTLTLLTGGTLNLFTGNQVRFDLTDAGLNASQTYELLNFVDGGFTSGPLANTDYLLGATPGGFTSITLTATNTSVYITTGTLITGTSYWRGLTDTTWNGAANNWSQDKAGAIPALSIPGQGTDVVFQWDAPTNAAVTTTLEQNFKVNSLTFEASTTPANTPVSVTINPGVSLTNRIEVAPQVATDGIKITAGGPAAVTISGPVRLGANQTWGVADAGSVLSLGSLFNKADVTKTGLGKVTLTGAADATFNADDSTDITISAGTLEMTNVAALGDPVNGNFATVTVNSTGAFYYNGAASNATNLGMALTLGGGTLSAGTATQTYSGTVNVSANSTINMAENNGAPTATARSITLSGVVSGSNSLTINSNNGVIGGNQYNGTLTFSNAGNTWNGDLIFERGTVVLTNAASPNFTTNDVTFNGFGRFNLQGLNGALLTRTGTLTYAAGAIAELGVDNTGAVVNSDFTVDQNGVVTLGSAGTGASMRIYLSDAFSKMNITGGVTLGGNGSISVGGDAAGVATISSVISDGGSGYSLAVNDDAGGWGTTNRTLRLTGLNTFSGNFTVDSGIVQFDTVTNIGGAASSLGQGSAITMGVGSARLTFIGGTSQSTDRPITTVTGAQTLSAEGTGGATITYAGAITVGPNGDGSQIVLTGLPGSAGIISGGITETGDSADMTVNGGTWTHQTATSRVGNDVVVTGASTIFNLDSGLFQLPDDLTVTAGANLNLNGTGVLSFNTPTLTSGSVQVHAGGIVTFGANDPVVSTEFDSLRVGTDGAGIGTVNMGAFNQTVTELILGNRNADRSGLVNGTGLLTVTGNFDIYGGTINANLASSGTNALEKISLNTVTLAGDNSGLASTGSTVVSEGTLILDYTASNTTKLRALSTLEMRGANLILNGNAGAGTVQTVGSLNLDSTASDDTSGSAYVTLNAGAGQDIVLNLNGVTRTLTNRDATIRFILPAGTQSATNGITTDALNTFGSGANAILGAWATVDDGSGVYFARNLTNAADGNIVPAVTTVQDSVGSWGSGENLSDSTGFSGTLNAALVNSLRFNAAGGSDLTLASTGVLGLASGGLLVTGGVGGTPSLVNGTLFSGSGPELIITQASGQTFTLDADIRINHSIIKTGSGTLRLTGQNVYTDETEIQEGTLQVSGGNAIGDIAPVMLSNSRATTLELLGNETIGRLQGGSRNTDQDLGTVDVGTHTLTINEVGGGTTFSGMFTGSGQIIKQGSSNLQLLNVSSGFTGIITVESGLFYLAGIGQINASTIRINKGGTFMIDELGTTRSGTRIPDTTTITLNSADGGFAASATVRGLALRTDQDSALDETVGTINFNTGASYVGMEATSSSDDSDLIATDIVRLNNATMNVRGTNLGGSSSQENEFRIGDSTNETAFIATLVGGGGLATSKNISIVPWAIGQGTAGALNATHMGNSLLTYASPGGFRPLDFATEYNTIALAGTTDNARESLASDLTGIAGKTINALVLDNTAAPLINVTGSGGGQTLAVTSGAMLFTVTGATTNTAYGTVLGGFDSGITVGGTNEYVVHVVNPGTEVTFSGTSGATAIGSTRVTVANTAGLQPGMAVFGNGIPAGATVASVTNATTFEMTLPADATTSSQTFRYSTLENLTATISSPLTSTADITKSGRGALVLSGVNTAGGGTKKTTINEGILEIADLDNIGGNTGALVFAGGTLRLGASLTDDISQRTITLLDGGGTIDTNGVSLALAGSVGAGSGGLTKVGLGNLTLNAAATYTGATTILGGTLTVGANNATGAGGGLNIGAGATLDLGTSSITAGLVSVFGISPAISGTGAITASRGFAFTNAGDISVGAVLAGAGGLFKSQTTVLTLTGLNTYAGTTEIQAGTLSVNSIGNVGGGASALGNPSTAENGIIRMGSGSTATTLQYTGTGHSSNRLIGMQGSTGSVTLDADGTGALGLGGARFENAGNKTLVLRGASDAATIDNTLGQIMEIGGVLTLNKTDANTWLLTAANSYTGPTQIDNGTLKIGVNDSLPTTTAVRIGTGATAGTLDLNGFNQTIGSLTAQTNSVTETNNLIVDAGKTLTVSGAVTLGANAASSTTRFTASGGGTFVNNNSGGTFQIGGATGSTNTNAAIVDFSALATFTVDLGSGSFRLGDNSSYTSAGTGLSVLTLATDNTITAGTLYVAATQANALQTLHLGSATNTLKVDTLDVGGNTRGVGLLDFASGTGTMSLRAADGASRAVMNLGTSTTSTGSNLTGTVDFSGHGVDLLVSTLTMADRSLGTTPGASATTATMTFDDGSLDITSATMARRTSTGTGNATATLNLGDGAVAGSPTTTIGSLNMAINTSAGGTATADLNVTGGNVNIGTGSGTAINMANANASRTATSTIDLTGGTTTITGDIIRTGGAGTENATLTVSGGTLNMSGFNIGTAGANVSLVAESGGLANVNTINGTGGLTKTTGGTLAVTGSNNYTGPTVVSAGTLEISGTLNATSNVQVDGGTVLLSGASERVVDTATLTLNGGALAYAPSLAAGTDETFASLTLSSTSSIDFANAGSGGFDLFLNGWGAHTPGASMLTITNWNGTAAALGIDATDDRLIFTGNAATFMTDFAQTDISFTGFGSGYAAIQFGGQFEVVPVPEPSSTSLIGAAALLGLMAFRERHRMTGKARRKSSRA